MVRVVAYLQPKYFLKLFQPSCQYLDIVISIFVIINLVPIFDLIYFARAIGRLTKPPFTTLLPLSCITLANKEAIFRLQHRLEKAQMLPGRA